MLETFFDLDELVAAIGCARRLVVAGRGPDDLRRRRPDAGRCLGRGRGRAPGRARRRGGRRESQRRPGRGAERPRLDAAGRARARRSRTSASRASQATASSSRTRRRTTSPSSQRRGGSAPGSSAAAGTTPAQIEAIRGAIDDERAPAAPLVLRERELADAAEAAPDETRLARMLRGQEFVVSVQLDPPLGANNTALVEAGRALASPARRTSSTSTTTRAPGPG